MFSNKLVEKAIATQSAGAQKGFIHGHPMKNLSAFQILLLSLLQADGDVNLINKKFRGPLRCSVKETQPHFLLTDGSYFLQAYFTEQSYTQFRNENSSLRVTDLKDVMVQINKWSIELVYNTSNDKGASSFTSYAGVEMRMIVH